MLPAVIDALPALALAAGIMWPSLRRTGVLSSGRRTLEHSRARVLAP